MKYLRKSSVLTFNTSFPFRLERQLLLFQFFYGNYYKKLVFSNDWGAQIKLFEASFNFCQFLINGQILLFLFYSISSFFLHCLFSLTHITLAYCTDKMHIMCTRDWMKSKFTFTVNKYFRIQIYWLNTRDLWKESGSHDSCGPYWNNAGSLGHFANSCCCAIAVNKLCWELVHFRRTLH